MTDVAAAVPANETPGVNLEPAPEARDPRARSCSRCSCSRSTRPSSARRCRSSSPTSTATTLYTWAVTIYLLTSTISGPIYGKLSDLYGRRPIFIWARRPVPGRVDRAPASARRCGSSSSFRGLQGLGGGAVFPIALAVIADLYPPAGARQVRRPVRGGVRARRRCSGRRIGGIITDNFGWHWIFFVNVPIGARLAVRLLAAAAADQATRRPAATSTTSARRCSRRPSRRSWSA